MSANYGMTVTYVVGQRPRIRVLDPPLEHPDDKQLPHVFAADDLCVYFRNEWDGSMIIAETIIPWTCEWLLHYELWRATGIWTGGGHEFRKKDTRA